MWICGGGSVVQPLIREDQIDEYHLSLIPTILGSGIRLFGELADQRKLRLVHTQSTGGIAELIYRRGGGLMSWTQVSYLYDGTYAGFLTCVFDSFRHREEPADFTPFDQAAASFYPQRAVETHREKARRVYRSLDQFGREGKRWAVRGFLTCLEERELWLWRFYQLGFEEKSAVSRDLTHPVVDTVRKAVRHLEEEAHLLTGFVRFSELDGVLAGEISPKNRVLPLLRPHFCGRYPQEQFLLYDKTHREALIHVPGRWSILPMEEFQMGRAGTEELQYRPLRGGRIPGAA